MFFVGEVVKPSGNGRTASWEGMVGTVIRVGERSVFVQWHDCPVKDELDFEEVVSTGTFAEKVPECFRDLGASEKTGTFPTEKNHDDDIG